MMVPGSNPGNDRFFSLHPLPAQGKVLEEDQSPHNIKPTLYLLDVSVINL